MTDYTATLTTSAPADVVEGLLDDLPGSAMLGGDSDALVDVVFPVQAETPVAAMLTACGAVVRHSAVLGDAWLSLSVGATDVVPDRLLAQPA